MSHKKNFKDIAYDIYYNKYDKLFLNIFVHGFLEGFDLKISNLLSNEDEIYREELMRK